MTVILYNLDEKRNFYADVPNFTPQFYVDEFFGYLDENGIKYYYNPDFYFFPKITRQPDLFEPLRSWRDYVTFDEDCPL